ncbi:peroxisome targeting signal receptor [Thelephora terrestris]|uniref:Peroxisome targeting signal receptor n=1 Tax=Thelephora terrestris TaxID=56493 RepID=A0A9P6HUK3_9AGAM|nr:peroxisome targeting signal receptor [Thelephora terrestris]
MIDLSRFARGRSPARKFPQPRQIGLCLTKDPLASSKPTSLPTMSLQSLMSGADCAVQSNPLAQVMKHTEGDRSLQQDRIAGPSSSRLHYLPGTITGQTSERDIQLVHQFFDGPPATQHLAFGSARLVSPLPAPQVMSLGPGNPRLEESWMESSLKAGFRPLQDTSFHGDANWVMEFSKSGPTIQRNQSLTPQQDLTRNAFSSQTQGMYGMSGGMYRPYGGMGMVNGLQPQMTDKGKGKMRVEDFDAAFAQAAASYHTESAKIEEVQDITEALASTVLDDTSATKQATPTSEDFKTVWEQLQKSELPPPAEDMVKWEAEFNQMMNNQRNMDFDYDTMGLSQWEAPSSSLQSLAFDKDGIPLLGDYEFEKNNQFMAEPSGKTLLERAKILLNENGSLSEASLMLEAAIQKTELGEGGYEAWILLGEARNMDEREELGIKALTEGVRRAREIGAHGVGMLALAISYTNEGYERASHTMLLRWLQEAHPDAEIPHTAWSSLQESPWFAQQQVTQAFLDYARIQHSKGVVDADLQAGLGVLFYTSNQFDRAKDCFEAALSVRPTDYQLWNRLGSSLSNGSNHEESLGAYREALNLRPTYIRAILNVAVACLNIGAFKESAEHILGALSLQSASGDGSESLWSTLRRVMSELNRHDLVAMTEPGGKRDLEVFRNNGFDF